MKPNEANITLFIIFTFLSSSCSSLGISHKRDFSQSKVSSLVLTGYGSATYQNKAVKTYLAELKALKANTASFLYTCYVENKDDSNIDCQSYDSPKQDRLSQAIKSAKKAGFIVALRLYIDLKDSMWRCYWDPADKTDTFKNIENVLKKMAIFSEKHHVELLIIGAEYCQLSKKLYTKNWRQIISEVRKRYSGKITYGANWGKHNNRTEWKDIGFWPELDYIGIDHYRPLPISAKGNRIEKIQTNQFQKYQELAKRLNKEILITELGFPGHEKGFKKPYEWRLKGKSNELRQAKNYARTLQAITISPMIKGVFIWRKKVMSKERMQEYLPHALGYELYHRKAWYEIQRFFNTY